MTGFSDIVSQRRLFGPSATVEVLLSVDLETLGGFPGSRSSRSDGEMMR